MRAGITANGIFRNVIAAGPAKIHLDVQFNRYRARQPQMDFSGKTALVTGALSGSRISLKMPGGGVRIVVAGTRFEAFG